MIAAMEMRDGIVALGIFYLVAATMFLLVTQRDKHLLTENSGAVKNTQPN